MKIKLKKTSGRERKSSYTLLILVGCIMLAAFGVAVFVSCYFFGNRTVATSVISDINIMLITTNATMIGLFVTAFIFLNDSLKSRAKEDATISDAVNDILHVFRWNMFFLALGTIVAIVATLVLNLLLDTYAPAGVEQLKIALTDYRWILFLLFTAISVCVIIWIILSSRSITDSDKLIYKYSQKKRNALSEKICEKYNDIIEDSNKESNPMSVEHLIDENGNVSSSVDFQRFLCDNKERPAYSFSDAYKKAEKQELISDNLVDIFHKKKLKEIESWTECVRCEKQYGEYEIELGKIVRLLENLVGRISDNNIDKSIMNTDYKIDSIENGFHWLYAGESQANNSAVGDFIDVRDRNRYLDHVKYKVITNKTFETRPFSNFEVEIIYDRARLAYENLPFEEKRGMINDYKSDTADIIDEFFDGYKDIIAYRDAMVHQKRYKKKKIIQDKNDIKQKQAVRNKEPIQATEDKDPASGSVNEDRVQEYEDNEIKLGRGVKKQTMHIVADCDIVTVVNYAKLLRRVLLDRFMSFVRTDDLSLGNSTMDKGWFNYSELSKSNFTHSSFKYACLEYAILRDCDLSTCSFVMADASSTDFSGSNFSYSDLTGMDLQDANLNNTQMNAVVLRDARIDNYGGLEKLLEPEPALAKHEDKRIAWRKNLADSDVARRDMCTECRRGKYFDDIMYTIVVASDKNSSSVKPQLDDRLMPIYNSLLIDEDDESAAILLNESGKKTVLDDSYFAIREYLKSYIDYRKYSKIDKKLFDKFSELRYKEEQPPSGDKSKKENRVKQHGKVYFHTTNLTSASVNKVQMTDMDFSHVQMAKASFRDSDLSGADMYYTTASDAMFYHTNLISLDAYRSDFKSANFNEATLIDANILDCNLNNVNFKKAILQHATLIKTYDAAKEEAKFESEDKNYDEVIYLSRSLKNKALLQTNVGEQAANLKRLYSLCEQPKSTIEGRLDETGDYSACNSNFSEMIAKETVIMNINFSRSNFTESDMAMSLIYNNVFFYSTLKKVNFSNVLLYGNSFHQANCDGINLQHAVLFANEFSNANLHNATLNTALVTKCIFDQANLTGINLSRTKIKNCTFVSCSFDGANIAGAVFKNVIFCDIDFSKAIGLDEAVFINCKFGNTAGGVVSDEKVCLSNQLDSHSIYVWGQHKGTGLRSYSTEKTQVITQKKKTTAKKTKAY